MKKWMISWKELSSLEDSDILIKGVSKTMKNEAKQQKVVFLSMLLDTLAARLLGNMLACKWVKWLTPSNIPGWGVMIAGEGTIRAGQNIWCRLIL